MVQANIQSVSRTLKAEIKNLDRSPVTKSTVCICVYSPSSRFVCVGRIKPSQIVSDEHGNRLSGYSHFRTEYSNPFVVLAMENKSRIKFTFYSFCGKGIMTENSKSNESPGIFEDELVIAAV